MLSILWEYKSLVVIFVLLSTIALFCGLYKIEKSKNYAKQIKIEQLEYQNQQYAYTLQKTIDAQKRSDEALLKIQSEQSVINENINHYEDKVKDVFKEETWDEQSIPPNVVCLIDCVQRGKAAAACQCATDHSAKLLSRVRETDLTRR